MHHFHLHDEKLRCPYKGCGKAFEKPTVLTDSTVVPRETYYACPYCQSKLDVMIEDLKITSIKPTEYPKVLDSPAKCARYVGFLNTIPKDGAIPDECLICPKVLQCTVRQKQK
jgi:DNA-directed RNA polymerase subunit RPC12/RpoP